MKKYSQYAFGCAVVTAICCFTPILVWLFVGIGLASVIPFLDYFLYPLLALWILLGTYFFWRSKQNVVSQKKGILTCPKCGHKQEVSIPTDRCLPFYTCGGCKQTIGVPPESKNCCVVCEYSETTCPVGHKSK